jgi:hypothetical protein
MGKPHDSGVLEIPTTIWESAKTKEELEDWLLSQNPKLIRKLRRIRRQENMAGKGKSLAEVARQWHIDL